MLFDSSLRRDLSRTFGATLVVLLTIFVTISLFRMLGQAAAGRISPQDVVLALGFFSLSNLPTLLSLSLFISIVATLGRMYRDSEMTIWFASGAGLSRFVRPVLRVGLPVVALITGLVFFASPWLNHQANDLKERFARRSDLSRIAPGQFQTSRDGSRTFFIERSTDEGRTGRNVFILERRGDNESVTSARSGRIEVTADASFLVLDRGQRNEQNMKTDEKTLSSFDSYRIQAGERARTDVDALPPRARPTLDLLMDPEMTAQGELTARLGMALGACNMVLLAIGLSATQPRRASNWNLLFALLSFYVYFNLISLSNAWVSSGKVAMGVALVAVHGGAFVFALALLWWRDNGTHFSLKKNAMKKRTVAA
jgi:lipopolysaccharide export system permease protein